MKIFLRALWIIGLVIWAVLFSMGFNYAHPGGLALVIILFVATAALMGADLFLLNLWANPQHATNRSTAALKEKACLVVFGILVVATAVLGVARFVTIQTEVRPKAQAAAADRIEEMIRLFGDESVSGSFAAYADMISDRYMNYCADQYVDPQQAKDTMTDALLNDSYYSMQQEAGVDDNALAVGGVLYNSAYAAVSNWIPWEAANQLEILDSKSNEWPSKLVSISRDNEWIISQGEESVFKPLCDTDSDLASMVNDPDVSDWNFMSILIILVLVFMMIFPYLREKDWSASGPKKGQGHVWEG